MKLYELGFYIMRNKVLFFTQTGVGGAERVTLTIAKLLDPSEYEVKVVLLGPNKEDNIVRFIPKNFEIIHISYRNVWTFVTYRIYKLIKQEAPTHVFSSISYINFRVIAAAKLSRNIRIIIRSNTFLSAIKRKDKLFFIKRLYKYADVIVAQNKEMRLEMIERLSLPSDKVVFLHNPLDIDTIERKVTHSTNPFQEKDAIKFVHVGSFSRNKGQDIAIKAFAQVRDKLMNAHLYLIGRYGGDDYSKSIQSLINKMRIEDCVHLIGFTDNPYIYMKYADCFVLSSRVEGLPNVLIEAQYLHIPAAAAKCIPIIEQIIQDGTTGYCAAVEDVDSLADCMCKAYKLGRIESSYKPAEKNDFIKLFQ